jgi:hypothetical protein
MEKKQSDKNLTIYLGEEKELFWKIRDELKSLWYDSYGESLTNNKMILTAMQLLRDSLSGKENRFDKKKYKLQDKYWRL